MYGSYRQASSTNISNCLRVESPLCLADQTFRTDHAKYITHCTAPMVCPQQTPRPVESQTHTVFHLDCRGNASADCRSGCNSLLQCLDETISLTSQSLASASEKEVLRQWEGLGYYSRARNLHKTARLLADQNGGNLPDQYERLVHLPGIGDYTASAILSIAFRKPYPVLDANVRRVVRRLLAIEIEGSKSTQQIREFLHTAISPKRPGEFNEAMMELGQTICRVRNPIV